MQLRQEVMGSISFYALPRYLKPSNRKKAPVNRFIKTMATTLWQILRLTLPRMKTPQPPSLICKTPNKNEKMTFTNNLKTRNL